MPEPEREQSEPTEIREVIVDEPQLSSSLNEHLTEQAREVIGERRVRVPKTREHPSHGERPKRTGIVGVPLPRNWIVTQVGATLIIVLVVAAVATSNSWWAVGAAVVVLLLMIYILVAAGFRMMSNSERPDPSTVAAMEEEGIRDPEQHFSDIVHEFTEDTGAQGENDRTASVQDDPVKAAAEHQSAITPSSGATTPIGPGSN